MKTILISGFYGNMNIGDESILEVMVKEIKENHPQIKILVFSDNPKETKARYGVDSVNSWALGTSLLSSILSKLRLSFIETIIWWLGGTLDPRIIREIIRCDVFILGGGGLLSDEVSRTLPRWLGKVCLANFLRKKVMIYAVGVINLTTSMGKFLSKSIINKVDLITVRDIESKKTLVLAGVDEDKIFITADPAVNLEAVQETNRKEILKNEGIKCKQFNIGICISPFYFSRERWKNWKPKYRQYTEVWEQNIDKLLKCFEGDLVFIPMQYTSDYPFITDLLKKNNLKGNKRIHILRGMYTPNEVLGIYSEMDVIIGMRLHSMILSSVANTPFVAISYSPKTKRFLNKICYERYSMNIKNLNSDNICNLVRVVIDQKRYIKEHLKNQIMIVQEREHDNIKFLNQILEDGFYENG